LDEIAWLLNIRGFDVPFNPVLVSYAIISLSDVRLYVDPAKLSEDVLNHFKGSSIKISNYSSFFQELGNIAQTKLNVWVDTNSSIAVYNSLKPDVKDGRSVIVDKSPIILEKSLKNPVELNGFRNCSIRDAVALVKFFSWLEKELSSSPSDNNLTEWSVSEKLRLYRQEQDGYINLSFAAIASTGSNAAIIHYHPEEKSSSKIQKDLVFLCDSGGQYKDGTTDVTRTFHFGNPSEKEKIGYTLVLKGVINLTTLIFPNNTNGLQIDALARMALWQFGLDYRHGTGHGIGHFLNVHEGPHQISFRPRAMEAPLKENMIVTNEPGYYEDSFFWSSNRKYDGCEESPN